MGFPTSVDKTAPADSDNPSAGAAQIRNLKLFLEDLLGIQDGVSYSAAALALGAAGQVTVSQPRMLVQDGNATTPSFGFAGATGTGLAYDGATTAIAILRNGSRVGYLGILQAPDMGGTGQDTSASTGVPVIDAGVWSVGTTLPVAKGGTGSATAAAARTALAASAIQRGYLYGLTLSNGTDATNDIDIAVGECASDDSAESDRVVMANASVLTKRLDASWAVGTGNGGLDTGSINDTTYHVFLIQRPDTGVVDALFSASPTSPTMPANYTKQRRIGSFRRASEAIVPFYQKENVFYIKTPLLDLNQSNPGATLTAQAVTVPTGVIFTAILNVLIGGHATVSVRVLVSPIACGDVAPEGIISSAMSPTPCRNIADGGTELQYGSAQIQCLTDTSAQVQYHCSASDATTLLQMTTIGWIDTRQ